MKQLDLLIVSWEIEQCYACDKYGINRQDVSGVLLCPTCNREFKKSMYPEPIMEGVTNAEANELNRDNDDFDFWKLGGGCRHDR